MRFKKRIDNICSVVNEIGCVKKEQFQKLFYDNEPESRNFDKMMQELSTAKKIKILENEVHGERHIRYVSRDTRFSINNQRYITASLWFMTAFTEIEIVDYCVCSSGIPKLYIIVSITNEDGEREQCVYDVQAIDNTNYNSAKTMANVEKKANARLAQEDALYEDSVIHAAIVFGNKAKEVAKQLEKDQLFGYYDCAYLLDENNELEEVTIE